MNGSANGGADLAAISAITPHICIRELEKISILSLVNIRSASRGALGNLPRRRSRCSGLPVTRRRPKTSRETRRFPRLKRRSGSPTTWPLFKFVHASPHRISVMWFLSQALEGRSPSRTLEQIEGFLNNPAHAAPAAL
jgi:hypothetical protein